MYEARQDLGDGGSRVVAVKALHDTDRAKEELRATVSLDHPNIVTVYDCGLSADGRLCLVMPYYRRRSLADRENPRMRVSIAVAAATAVARALRHAHRERVLHCDVKPGNILVRDDNWSAPESYVLSDFGMARLAEKGDGPASAITRGFASPRLLRGETPSELDDVWALGATLFALLEGDPPELTSVELSRTDVPPELEKIIKRCLASATGYRYRNAAELCVALEDFGRQHRTPATDRSPTRSARPRHRWRTIAIAAAIAVGVAAIGAGLSVAFRSGGSPSRTAAQSRPPSTLAPIPPVSTSDTDAAIPNRFVEVVNTHSGLCLDKANEDNRANARVMQWNCWRNDNQLWNLGRAGIPNLQHDPENWLVLTVPNANRDPEVSIRAWPYAASTAGQRWQITSVGDARDGWRSLRIRSAETGMCLAVRGASVKPGESVVQTSCDGGPEQIWRISVPWRSSVTP